MEKEGGHLSGGPKAARNKWAKEGPKALSADTKDREKMGIPRRKGSGALSETVQKTIPRIAERAAE